MASTLVFLQVTINYGCKIITVKDNTVFLVTYELAQYARLLVIGRTFTEVLFNTLAYGAYS